MKDDGDLKNNAPAEASGQDAGQDTAQEQEIKRPSVLSQAIPYLITIVVLAYVFNGLSSNVVDERIKLAGDEWTSLERKGAKPKSVRLYEVGQEKEYCGGLAGDADLAKDCPEGVDFVVEELEDQGLVRVRRSETSGIADGIEISANYSKKVSPREIWEMVKAADLRLFLPMIVLHCLIFFFADVFSFGQAYRFFNVPDMGYKEIMIVRGAPYIIQVGLAPMAEALFPLYMWRVKKVPVTEVLSSNLWTIILDTVAIFSLITPAVAYNVFVNKVIPFIGVEWLLVCGIYWVVILGNIIFWHTDKGRRTAEGIAAKRLAKQEAGESGLGGLLQLLRTFSMARWDQYARVYLARAVLWVSFFASNYIAMRAMGIEPGPALAMVGIPLVVSSTFLPVSVGGYGGTQLIAWLIFAKLGDAGTADQVIGYSLLYSTAFLIGRALIGLVFIRQFWKRCFTVYAPRKEKAEEE